jgi:YVTN family beta-propeller protein
VDDEREVGSQPDRDADVRTFLIADVRGYTRFTQEHGDEAAGELAAHFAEVAGAAVSDLGGRLLELRGDEALAVFTSARGALRAALELQRRLRPHERQERFPAGVGIGLDSGEAVPVEGGYRGGALNLAARLCSIAGPGQILASETVVSLARRVDGLSFAPRKPVRLKGLAQPIRVVEIVPDEPLPAIPQEPSRPRQLTRWAWAALGAGALAVLVVGAVALDHLSGPDGLEHIPANSVGVIDTGSGAITSALPLEGRPGGVADGAGAVWITDEVAGTVLKLDPSEGVVVDTIPVGDAPVGVAVGAGAVWVANSESHNVSQINPESSTVVDTIPVGNGPTQVAVGAGTVWVANATDGTVARIDPERGRVSATIGLPQAPSGLAAEGEDIWATSAAGGLAMKVDATTNTVSQSFSVGNGPTGVALGDGYVWVANGPDGTVSRVDPSSGAITKINVPGAPQTLAFNDGSLWVASALSGTVAEIDAGEGTVVRTIDVGSDPSSLAVVGERVRVATLGAAGAHRGGTLRVSLQAGPTDTFDSIDPGVSFRAQAWQLLSLVHDGLVGFRRVGGPLGGTLVADLATAIPTPQDGGRTYTFQLRDGIRYSNGDLVQAHDFRNAIEREFEFDTGMAPGGLQLARAGDCHRGPGNCDLSEAIVTDDDAGTVAFHLAARDPEFLYKLAVPWGAPVPDGSRGPSSPGRPVPGTGPYRVVTFEPNRRLVLERNPNFEEWSAEARPDGFTDKMVWSFGMGPGRQTTAVERNDIDVMLDDPRPSDIHEIVTRWPTLAHPYVRPNIYFMFLNTKLAPFDDPRARGALNLAIDRGDVVEAWGGSGLAQPTCQVLPPGLPGYRPYCPYTKNASSSGTWSAPDPDRAKALVRASGTGGQEVVVFAPRVEPQLSGARRVADALAFLGYRVRVQTIGDFNRYYARAGSGSVQIGIAGWLANYPIASQFFESLLTCAAYQPDAPVNLNAPAFCDRRIDDYIERATALEPTQPSAATALWQRTDRAIVDAAPWAPLVNERGIDLVSERVGNYQHHPQWGVLLDQLWVQ